MILELKLPEQKEQTEAERKNYCASIFSIFPKLEKDIEEKMYEQLITTYVEAVGITKSKEERDFEVIRGNGIMEGMALLLEHWRKASGEHEANSKKEDFDKHSSISEL